MDLPSLIPLVEEASTALIVIAHHVLARAKPHWVESLKGDSGTIESVIRCPYRKMLGGGDGLAAGTELFGGSAGAGAGGG